MGVTPGLGFYCMQFVLYMLQYDGARCSTLALEEGEMSMGKLKYKTAHFMLFISNKGARCGRSLRGAIRATKFHMKGAI